MFSGRSEKNHRIYTDDQLASFTEYALKHSDLNNDGYVDYGEYRMNLEKARAKAQEKNK